MKIVYFLSFCFLLEPAIAQLSLEVGPFWVNGKLSESGKSFSAKDAIHNWNEYTRFKAAYTFMNFEIESNLDLSTQIQQYQFGLSRNLRLENFKLGIYFRQRSYFLRTSDYRFWETDFLRLHQLGAKLGYRKAFDRIVASLNFEYAFGRSKTHSDYILYTEKSNYRSSETRTFKFQRINTFELTPGISFKLINIGTKKVYLFYSVVLRTDVLDMSARIVQNEWTVENVVFEDEYMESQHFFQLEHHTGVRLQN